MSDKTEQPTAKKLRDARNKGQVAHSKDFTQTLLILALFGYLVGNADHIVRTFGQMILFPATLMNLAFEDAVNVAIERLLQNATDILLPVLMIVIGVGIFGEMIQVGVLLAFESIKPSGKKLNIIANLKNVFAKKNLIEFLKSILKISILSILVYMLLRDSLGVMLTIPRTGLPGVGSTLGALMKSLLVFLSLAYVVISLADFGWQRFNHRKELMMSKEEVKQEYKEMEGDPHIKHQRKHLHQEMLAHGAVNKAKSASVVITNPTHLAIALEYDKDKTPLPVVLAMGEGTLASMMIAAAKEAGVPVMQNIPLAHALFNTATVDQYIPSELIEPVAEVLRLVQKLGADGGTA
ncbi:type III secretion system export apparatus subunit SctU [Noviherbaspirillum sp. CPCC 100848]|uniref:Type III secretion system export apparatus subunit SctU n=1 Tax=Noviherbaspirillum album TaxID=3080276 RepID=A0ABU6JB05_9BURK|nr:type III secretion system export apparatus subunit SctU [Noviherbaspirillum sp. CPCC 100848]MEC4720718.1 type III secretion system export apparatus subunit SctU [Noviherbaspirillum sp. CPCC 100848]